MSEIKKNTGDKPSSSQENMQSSFVWRIYKPVSAATGRLFPRGTRRQRYLELGLVGLTIIHDKGWQVFNLRFSAWLKQHVFIKKSVNSVPAVGISLIQPSKPDAFMGGDNIINNGIDSNSTALLQIKSIKDLKKTKYTYEQRIENETRWYSQLERTEAGSEKIGAALAYIFVAFSQEIERSLGYNEWEYVADSVNKRDFTRILSLGTGTCDSEISLARKFKRPYKLVCVEFNGEILERGVQLGRANGVSITPLVRDVNNIKLDETFDIVFAHAALHHFVELEHIFSEINLHLAEDGYFIVIDVTCRNGQLLWPEQRKVIEGLLRALPPKFSFSHLFQKNIQSIVETDYSDASFECIRSQDILPLLHEYFQTIHQVDGWAFARRLTDKEFGPNFDLALDFDRSVINFILELDRWYVDNGILKPESVFWVGKKRG